MHILPSAFNFAQHNNEQTLHTLKTLGSKQPNLGWVKEGGSFYPVILIVYLTHH